MKSNFLYRIIRPLFVLYIKLIYKPIVIGKDKIPSGGCILVANHKNNLDFISVGLVTRRSIHFLAKSTLFKGILKPVLNLSGIIPVDRTIKDKTVIPKCIELINNDEIIGIFPEGTFNKTKNLLAPFKIGAVKIAFDTGRPIVPIAIGRYKKKMRIIVGDEVYIKTSDLEYENKKLMNIMEEMIITNGE